MVVILKPFPFAAWRAACSFIAFLAVGDRKYLSGTRSSKTSDNEDSVAVLGKETVPVNTLPFRIIPALIHCG